MDQGEVMGIWTTRSTAVGNLAMWAVRQSPYGYPEGLEAALAEFGQAFPADENGLSEWGSYAELDSAIWRAVEASPTVLSWNVPKSGHGAEMVFCSRYDRPSPDDDFIDLHALAGNVTRSVWAEEMATQGIEAGTGETERLDTKCESPVAESDAPDHPDATDYRNRAERAEAECKELREALERIDDLFAHAVQSDCENGVKWLNERAAAAYLKDAPATLAAIYETQEIILNATEGS